MVRNRTRIFVLPNGKNWIVKGGGAFVSNHRKKKRAIEEARKRAKRSRPSQIIIHKRDGTIGDESTFFSDPFPPRG